MKQGQCQASPVDRFGRLRRRSSACEFRLASALRNSMLLWISAAITLLGGVSRAGEVDLTRLRRMYVPAGELQIVLKQDSPFAVLPREEFERLLQRALQAQKNPIPQRPPVLTAADYQVREEAGRLRARVTVHITSFANAGETDLTVSGWSVLSGELDQQQAKMCRTGSDLNTLRVFLPEAGNHQLTLQMSCPLEPIAGNRFASVGLVGAAAEEWRMTLPAGKFLHVHDQDLQRPTEDDHEAEYILPVGGQKQLELTISGRRHDSHGDVLTFANTAYGIQVLPGEISWTAQTELQVFGRTLDHVVGTVPRSLEITGVESPGLEAWELSDDPQNPHRTRLTLQYRQAFQGQRGILLRGVLSQPSNQPWNVPDLALPDVTSNTGVIVVRYPEQVRLQILESQGVRPIAQAPAAEKLLRQPPQLFFAIWQPDFTLRCVTAFKDQEVQAAITTLLTVDEQGLDLAGTVTLETRQAPLFEVRLRIPADYRVISATVENNEVNWEQISDVAGINEIRIPVSPPLLPGQTRTATLQAHFEPETWPPGESPVNVPLPEIRLPQAAMLESLYGIIATGDFELAPLQITGLDPADRASRERLQQVAPGLRLAFSSQDTVSSGQLQISRRPALLSADVLTFFRVDQQTQHARFEASLSFEGGGIRQLTVQTSEAAGDRLRFNLRPGDKESPPASIVEQVPGEVGNGLRSWKLNVDRYLQGHYLLSSEIELPRGDAHTFAVPQMILPQARAQTGFIAIEAASDEFVRIDAKSADGGPLATIDPVDFPTSPEESSERIVAGYRYNQSGWIINVSPNRFPREALPGAIGHQISMSSVWDNDAPLQHRARLDFSAIGMQSLVIRLPEQAELWSTLLDGEPMEARKGSDGIHLPLTSLNASQQHRLDLFFATPALPQEHAGELRAEPPAFSVIAGSGDEQRLPVLKRTWELHYPEKTVLLDSSGDFRPQGAGLADSWISYLQRIRRQAKLSLLTSLIVPAAVIAALCGLVVLWRKRESRSLWGVLLGTVLLVGLFVVVVLINQSAVRQTRVPFGRPVGLKTDAPPAPPASEPVPQAAGGERLESELAKSNHGFSDRQQEKMELPRNAIPQTDLAFERFKSVPQKPGVDFDSDSNSLAGLAISDPAKTSRGRVGLLSVAIALEIPHDTRVQSFEYLGSADADGTVDLRVHYADRMARRLLLWTLAVGVALAGWWIRRTGLRFRLTWMFLTAVLPLGLLGILPATLLPLCEGVLTGGLLTVVMWSICSCVNDCLPGARTVRHACLFAALAFTFPPHFVRADQPAAKPLPAVPHVVIPYDSLGNRLNAERVWLPANLYRQLWKLEHPDAFPPQASVPAMIAEARYLAKIVDAAGTPRISIQARWVAINLREEPHYLPLPIKRVGIRATESRDAQPLLSVTDAGEIQILVPKQGVHVIDATLDVPLEGSVEGGSFVVETLPVGSGTMEFELPASKAPLSAEVNGVSDSPRHKQQGDHGSVEIAIDRGGRFNVSWQPERQAASDRLVQAETGAAAVISAEGLQINSAALIRVRQGTLRELPFDLPAGFSLKELSGEDVAGWEIQNNDSSRQLKVMFRRDITDETRLNIQLFRAISIGNQSTQLAIPRPVVRGVSRESGQLAVFTPDDLRTRLEDAQGLQQMDAGQFHPAAMPVHPQTTPLLAFRLSGDSQKLNVSVSRRQPEVRGTAEHGVQVDRRKLVIASRILLQLSESPKRLIEVKLPAKYLLLDVVCPHAQDWYVSDRQGTSWLTIELDQPRTGTIEVGLQGSVTHEPQTAEAVIEVPYVVGQTREVNDLGIWFDEIYQASIADSGAWRSIDSRELAAPIRELKGEAVQFAFRTGEDPKPLRFQLRTAEAEMSADAGILVAVGNATIDYGITLRWRISQAAADEFAFTVPNWIGPLELSGPDIRQIRSEAAGKDRTRWIISLIEPARAQYLVTAVATVAIPKDHVVRAPAVDFEIIKPGAAPKALQDQRQFAVLVNLSQNQVFPVEGAPPEPLTADQLPLSLPADLMRQAMEIVRVRPERIPAWRLQQPERGIGAQAIVLTASLMTTLEMDGSWRTQATYGVRNRGQQFLALRLPESCEILSVFVRGEPSRTLAIDLNDAAAHLIALPQTSEADLSFDVVLVLSGKLSRPLSAPGEFAARSVSIPVPQVVPPGESAEFGLPVAQTLWQVDFPHEVDVAPVTGRGTNLEWRRGGGWLTTQFQTLERVRRDVAEMKKVLMDVSSSTNSRMQAESNLKRLGEILQNQQQADAKPGRREDVDRFLYENSQILGEIQQSTAASQLGNQVPQPPLQDTRGFILQNNADFSSLNFALPKDSVPDTAWNFYRSNDARRALAKGKAAAEENESRSRLKQQLARQLPAVQQAQPAAPAVDELGLGRRQTGEMGGGMGGGVNGNGPANGTIVRPFGTMNPRIGGKAPGFQDFNAFVPGALGVFDSEQSNAKAAEQAKPSQKSWGQTGGLSIPITLPPSDQHLTLSKIGGGPELTLHIRSRSVWPRVLGIVWCVSCLLIGMWLLRQTARRREHPNEAAVP